MPGYQPGAGRGAGERPGRSGGAPDGSGPRGARRDGPPATHQRGTGARGTGTRGTGYPDGSYRDPGHPDPGYPGPGYRDAGYRDGYPSGYRDAYAPGGDDRDAGYPDAAHPVPGYRGAGYQGRRSRAGYQDGYREDRPRRRAGLAPDPYDDGYGGPGGGYGPGDGHSGPGGGREAGRGRRRDTTGGADGNERLTALTGALLLGLLAAEGVTILAVHQLLTLHFFIGMLLVGPVLLKAGATGYRFTRYYTGAPGYRRKGPPAPLLRLLGPFLVVLSLAVIGTGVMLAVTGPSGQLWIFLHKASFVLWFGAMSIHVLAYVWRLPRLVTAEMATRAGVQARDVLAGRPARWGLLAASILLGLLLALLTYHQAGAWAGFTGGG